MRPHSHSAVRVGLPATPRPRPRTRASLCSRRLDQGPARPSALLRRARALLRSRRLALEQRCGDRTGVWWYYGETDINRCWQGQKETKQRNGCVGECYVKEKKETSDF